MHIGAHLVIGEAREKDQSGNLTSRVVLWPHHEGNSSLGVDTFRAEKALRGQTTLLPLVLPESQLNHPQDSEQDLVNVVGLTLAQRHFDPCFGGSAQNTLQLPPHEAVLVRLCPGMPIYQKPLEDGRLLS